MRRLLIGLLALILSCGESRVPPTSVSASRIPVEPGNFAAVTWLPDGWLVVDYVPSGDSADPSQVWRLRPTGERFERVQVADTPRCDTTYYTGPTLLPDGKASLLRACLFGDPSRDRFDLVALDHRRGTVTPLMRNGLGFRTLGTSSWSPTMDRGIASRSNGLCSTLVWLSRGGTGEAAISVNEGGTEYVIDQRLFDPGRSNCDDQPMADKPAWSPIGDSIAFLFSSDAIGLSGQERLDARWGLFLTDADGHTAIQLLKGITHAGRLVWSPDGRLLAFAGSVENRGTGTWLFNPETSELRLVTETPLPWFDWSPNGEHLVAISSVGGNARRPIRELATFNVSTLASEV